MPITSYAVLKIWEAGLRSAVEILLATTPSTVEEHDALAFQVWSETIQELLTVDPRHAVLADEWPNHSPDQKCRHFQHGDLSFARFSTSVDSAIIEGSDRAARVAKPIH